MNAHSVVEDWETAPFDGGFGGLAALGSRGFDGAVESAGTWLFFRDGDPIAVVADLRSTPRPGDIDAFEGASGTQYESPTPSAVTLAAMIALDGDVRGRYFTDDTPLSAVHDTLSGGGFTGYVELSENVLSGDYYYVYVDGEVEHLGFVGSSRRIHGEEALTKAENEIGIYAVVAVSLPDVEVPTSEPEPEAEQETESEPEARLEPEQDSEPDPEPTSESDSEPELDLEPEPKAGSEPEPDTDGPGSSSIGGVSNDSKAPQETIETDRVDAPAATETDVDLGSEPAVDRTTTTRSPADPSERESNEPEPTGIGGLATRQVPSLDPEQSGHADPADSDTGRSRSPGQAQTIQRTPSRSEERASSANASANAPSGRAHEAYEKKISEYENRIEELERKLSDDETRIETLEAELEAVRNERDELEARLESLDSNGSTAHGDALSSEDALSGTSLFVREHTRGEATLEDAHAGSEDRESVAENLRIEYHTTFDSTGATVDGEPFETWLRSSPPYEFAEWLITELLFEIRSTHAQEGLRPLYDTLPAIDRVAFGETISIDSEPGDEDERETEEVRFDIVARDKKGNPLIVAHFDQRRDPTRADTIGPFVTASSNVCEANGTLAAGVVVTSSYFEADAMSATEEATSSSLLSRSRHRSYVKLSRSNGYHLCLVEARDDTFNLTVPEL